MPSGEGFEPLASNCFVGILTDYKGKRLFSGLKTRQLGVLAMFKQSLEEMQVTAVSFAYRMQRLWEVCSS